MWSKTLSLAVLIPLLMSLEMREAPNNKKSRLIKVTGELLSADSLNPITSTATITYETLPNGSDYGIMYVKNGSMHFNFPLRRNSNYKIQAKAPGFTASSRALVDLEGSEEEIYLKIVLNPAKKGDVLQLNNLIFEQGKYEIRDSSKTEIDNLIATLNVNPAMVVQLEGHTDIRGDERLNMELSKNRVQEVKKYMTRRGVDASRIKTKAFGEEYPLASRGSEEERKINRRVEVRILAM